MNTTRITPEGTPPVTSCKHHPHGEGWCLDCVKALLRPRESRACDPEATPFTSADLLHLEDLANDFERVCDYAWERSHLESSRALDSLRYAEQARDAQRHVLSLRRVLRDIHSPAQTRNEGAAVYSLKLALYEAWKARTRHRAMLRDIAAMGDMLPARVRQILGGEDGTERPLDRVIEKLVTGKETPQMAMALRVARELDRQSLLHLSSDRMAADETLAPVVEAILAAFQKEADDVHA